VCIMQQVCSSLPKVTDINQLIYVYIGAHTQMLLVSLIIYFFCQHLFRNGLNYAHTLFNCYEMGCNFNPPGNLSLCICNFQPKLATHDECCCCRRDIAAMLLLLLLRRRRSLPLTQRKRLKKAT